MGRRPAGSVTVANDPSGPPGRGGGCGASYPDRRPSFVGAGSGLSLACFPPGKYNPGTGFGCEEAPAQGGPASWREALRLEGSAAALPGRADAGAASWREALRRFRRDRSKGGPGPSRSWREALRRFRRDRNNCGPGPSRSWREALRRFRRDRSKGGPGLQVGVPDDP